MVLLTKPPVYFPIDKGRYELGPGLRAFGFDFGNQAMDQNVFQIAENFQSFRDNKLKARLERFDKYVQTKNLNPEAESAIAQFIIQEICHKYPEIFEIQKNQEMTELHCRHTEDVIVYNPLYCLQKFSATGSWSDSVPPKNLLDALMLQLPEDISILEKKEDKDWLSYLHLSSPSHWAAEDKIGLDFSAVHKPIPGIEILLKAAGSITDAMIHKGPYVRFVWSFVTDSRLNHHPVAPTGEDVAQWKGRSFNPENPESFYLRIERQVTWGFPAVSASLFVIGLSFIPAAKIKANPLWKAQLLGALNSMTPASRQYKGVAHCFDDLIKYLEN